MKSPIQHLADVTSLLREVFEELPDHFDGRYDRLERRVDRAELKSAELTQDTPVTKDQIDAVTKDQIDAARYRAIRAMKGDCKKELFGYRLGGLDRAIDALRVGKKYAAGLPVEMLESIRTITETSCSHCDYEESDGSLFNHCKDCRFRIVKELWALTHQ